MYYSRKCIICEEIVILDSGTDKAAKVCNKCKDIVLKFRKEQKKEKNNDRTNEFV